MTAASPPAAATPTAPRYEGWLQGIGSGNALGWCRNVAAPQEPVKIAILVDGEIVAEANAELERPDLAGDGENAIGFLIALPESLRTPGRRRVLALAGPERVPLATAPSFWQDPGSAGGWSDVVFEPGEISDVGVAGAQVPAPPKPSDRRAVVQDGWLLDARESEPSRRPDATELDRLVASLVDAAGACAALDAAYIPAIVPAKRHALGLAPAGERESALALLTRLRQVDDVDLIDLLPVLRDARGYGAGYHRTDADWNDRGAFFAARALLKEARKRTGSLRSPTLADLSLRSVPGYRGTLADAPKLEVAGGELVPRTADVDLAEEGVVLDAHPLRALRMPVERHLAEGASVHMRIYENPDNDDEARLAVVGGACCLPLLPWLAEPNRRAAFFWSPTLPLHELELELPRVVLHLIPEAALLTPRAELPDGTASRYASPRGAATAPLSRSA